MKMKYKMREDGTAGVPSFLLWVCLIDIQKERAGLLPPRDMQPTFICDLYATGFRVQILRCLSCCVECALHI